MEATTQAPALVCHAEGQRHALYQDAAGYFEGNANPDRLGRIRRLTVRQAGEFAAEQLEGDAIADIDGLPRLLRDLAGQSGN